MIGVALFVIGILVIGIWVFVEMRRFKHKLVALFLIFLVLFMYFSITFVFKDKPVDYKTVPGVIKATGVYFNWLFSIGGNFKSITGNAVKMDWTGTTNSTK